MRELYGKVGRATIEGLFEKVCLPNSIISIHPMQSGLSGAFVLKVHISHPVRPDEVLQVVKIGRSEQIKLETKNFEEHAYRSLNPTPKLIHFAGEDGWSISSFSFESGKILADQILELTFSNRQKHLSELIDVVLKYFEPWHSRRRMELVSVAAEKYRLKSGYFEDFERLRSELNSQNRFPLPPSAPLNFASREWYRFKKILTLLCTCHGDLHPFNVLLGKAGPCAIDFQFTAADHHFLKDFVLLEMDALLKVLAPRQLIPSYDFQLFLDIKNYLFEVEVDGFLLKKACASGPRAKAAICIARRIREHAWRAMDGKAQHICEYFIGLLRYAISRAGQANSGLTDAQRCIAIHFAFELDKKLDVWMQRN